MKHRRPNRPLVSAQSILTFTALSQIVLYLWVTGRITGALAGSALTGVVLFGMLVRAVREVMADHVPDDEDFGPITDWPNKPAPSSASRNKPSLARPADSRNKPSLARPAECAARRC